MTEFVDKTKIVAEMVDNVAPGAKQVEKSVNKMGKKVAKDMDTFVGGKATKALVGFNETSEVSRQLLTQFGGEMGAQAGMVTFYGASLLKLVAKMNPLNLALTVAGAAAGALGFALNKMNNEALNDSIEKFGEMSKELEKVNETTESFIENQRLAALGITAVEKAALTAKKRLTGMRLAVAGLEDQLVELAKRPSKDEAFLRGFNLIFQKDLTEGAALFGIDISKTSKQKELEKLIKEGEADIARAEGLIADLEKLEPKFKRKEKEFVGLSFSELFEIEMNKVRAAAEAEAILEEAQRSKAERAIEIERNMQETMSKIAFDNAQRREQLWINEGKWLDVVAEKKIDLAEKEKEIQLQNYEAAIFVSEGMASLADELIKSEGKKARVVAVFTAITAAIKGSMQSAEAVEDFAAERYAQGAMHAMAAAMYFATATMAANKAMGIGGGGGKSRGAGSAAGSRGGGADFGSRAGEGRTTIININAPIGDASFAESIANAVERHNDRTDPGRAHGEVGP